MPPVRSCRSMAACAGHVLMKTSASPITTGTDEFQLRGTRACNAAVSYTLSKATTPRTGRQRHQPEREHHLPARRGRTRTECGRSASSRRITFSYRFPFNITAGTLTQLAFVRVRSMPRRALTTTVTAPTRPARFNSTSSASRRFDGPATPTSSLHRRIADLLMTVLLITGRSLLAPSPLLSMPSWIERRDEAKLCQGAAVMLNGKR